MNRQENFIKKGSMQFGIDQFCEEIKKYKPYKFGLVTNNAAKTADGFLAEQLYFRQDLRYKNCFLLNMDLAQKVPMEFINMTILIPLQTFPLSVCIATI